LKEHSVVITGTGVISALGDSLAQVHDSLIHGLSAIKPIQLFNTEGLGCPLAGEIVDFDASKYLGQRNLRPLDRTSRLVASSAQLALQDSGWSMEMRNTEEVGLVLGTMFCSAHTISEFDRRALEAGPAYASPMDFSNTVINAASGQTAIVHNLKGVNTTISTGATSGLQAICYGADLIRSGRARAVLAGGAEELCFESFYGFDRAGLLCRSDTSAGDFPIPFDARRNGAALGEGAALLMLEDLVLARERGARILAEIKGHGSSYDCSRGHDDKQSVAAIAVAIRQALNDAFLLPHEIDCLSASARGSRSGDRREVEAVVSVFNCQTRHLPVTAVKSMLGETLGASGPLQAAAMLETIREGVLPGIPQLQQIEDGFPLKRACAGPKEVDVLNGLINSTGFDGHSCSLILSRYED